MLPLKSLAWRQRLVTDCVPALAAARFCMRTATVDERIAACVLEAEARLAALSVETQADLPGRRQLLQAKSNLAALRARQATDRLQTSTVHPAAATHIDESGRGEAPLDR